MNAETPTTPEPPKAVTPPTPRRPCLRCGCIALIALCLLLVAGIIFLRYGVRKSFTDEQWERVQAMDTKVIDLGPEWQKPIPIPPAAVREFYEELDKRVEHIIDTYDELLFADYRASNTLLGKLRHGKTVPADFATSYAALLQESRDLVQLTSETLAIPGYTMELGLEKADTTNFIRLQVLAKLSGIVALDAAQHGDCMRAMEIAVQPMRTARRKPNAATVTHTVGIAMPAIAAGTIRAIADQCTDTAALRRGLNLMTELRSVAFPGKLENWRYGNSIGQLQRAAAYGYPVDLSPKPLTDFYVDSGHIFNGPFDKWIIANRPADDSLVAAAKARIANREYWAEARKEIKKKQGGRRDVPKWQRKIAELAMGADPVALLASLAENSLDETETRAKTALAIYDLTRLYLAKRLQQLGAPVSPEELSITADANVDGNAEETTSTADAASSAARSGMQRFDLNDPFSAGNFIYNPAENKHYSIGPDQIDEQMQIMYDASNGTVSHGDIWTGEQDY